MYTKIRLPFICLLFLFPILGQSQSESSSKWTLIYENDAEGKAVHGNIEDLIAAVRSGEIIRVAWISQSPTNPRRKVEHLADTKFLTIMSDEIVFAQIDPIMGQTPDFDQQTIVLKENLQWSMIAGSNGKSDSMMRHLVTGEIVGHSERQRGFKWYVER